MTLTVKFICGLMGLVAALLTFMAAALNSPAQENDAPGEYIPVDTCDEWIGTDMHGSGIEFTRSGKRRARRRSRRHIRRMHLGRIV